MGAVSADQDRVDQRHAGREGGREQLSRVVRGGKREAEKRLAELVTEVSSGLAISGTRVTFGSSARIGFSSRAGEPLAGDARVF